MELYFSEPIAVRLVARSHHYYDSKAAHWYAYYAKITAMYIWYHLSSDAVIRCCKSAGDKTRIKIVDHVGHIIEEGSWGKDILWMAFVFSLRLIGSLINPSCIDLFHILQTIVIQSYQTPIHLTDNDLAWLLGLWTNDTLTSYHWPLHRILIPKWAKRLRGNDTLLSNIVSNASSSIYLINVRETWATTLSIPLLKAEYFKYGIRKSWKDWSSCKLAYWIIQPYR